MYSSILQFYTFFNKILYLIVPFQKHEQNVKVGDFFLKFDNAQLQRKLSNNSSFLAHFIQKGWQI